MVQDKQGTSEQEMVGSDAPIPSKEEKKAAGEAVKMMRAARKEKTRTRKPIKAMETEEEGETPKLLPPGVPKVANEEEVKMLIKTLRTQGKQHTSRCQTHMMWLTDPENKYKVDERHDVLTELEHSRKQAKHCLDEALNLENQINQAYGRPLKRPGVGGGIANPFGGIKDMNRIHTAGEEETKQILKDRSRPKETKEAR